MTKAWCVRADWGTFTRQFREGGYVAIGWEKLGDLTNVKSRDELYPLYRTAYPDDKSNTVVGVQVGQIARLLFEICPGDIVITPDANTELLWHGVVQPEPNFIYNSKDPFCPYPYRRPVKWVDQPLLRSTLSVPLQNTLRSSLTVFGISPPDEVFRETGHPDLGSQTVKAMQVPYHTVIEQVLMLDDKEFELLVGDLLEALGFEGSEVVGKTGDGGVDARGELSIAGLAKVKLFVQAKRYKQGTKIAASTVISFRGAIPKDGQGAIITTAGFQRRAREVAVDPDFPRVGLIDGERLVELLVDHWPKIREEFRTRLGLKPGLVLV